MLNQVIDLEKNEKINMIDLLKLCPGYANKDQLGLDAYTDEDIQNCADLIEQCLQWVPSSRISAKDAINHPMCQFKFKF